MLPQQPPYTAHADLVTLGNHALKLASFTLQDDLLLLILA
jgi:hypothetical protein